MKATKVGSAEEFVSTIEERLVELIEKKGFKIVKNISHSYRIDNELSLWMIEITVDSPIRKDTLKQFIKDLNRYTTENTITYNNEIQSIRVKEGEKTTIQMEL